MEQALPEYLAVLSYEAISELIGLELKLLESTSLPIEVVSTGLPDIIVPVPMGYLDKMTLNETLTRNFCEKHQVVGIHGFELCDNDSELTASCRNFAPLFGISEESAAGSASGALACYLHKHLGDNLANFTFEQGRAMGCVSNITASVESSQGTITKVMVGGFAHEIGIQQIPTGV